MCDSFVAITADGVMFAKNSDRDPNESQPLEWIAAADHPAGNRVACTWIDVPQVEHTHAVLVSRPWWMWGAEMGANEHGVVIGNEAVFTRGRGGDKALLGMDLLRLALERATTAEDAVSVMVELLERHGQGGPCSYERPHFTYDNSFLVADPAGAFVVETAGRHWATEAVRGPGRSISNGLTIPAFAKAHARSGPHLGGVGVDPARPDRGLGLPGHRSRRSDGGVARPRWPGGSPVVRRPRRPRCPLRPRRWYGHLEPDHRLVGVGPARRNPPLGHGHVGPVHLAVQAGRRRITPRPRAPTDQCLRPPEPVVAARAPPPHHHARLRNADGQVPAAPVTGPRPGGSPIPRRRRRPSPKPTGSRTAGWRMWPPPACRRTPVVGAPLVEDRSTAHAHIDKELVRDRHPGTRDRSRPVRPGRRPHAASRGGGGARARGEGEGRRPDRGRHHGRRHPGRARWPVAGPDPDPHVRPRRGARAGDVPDLQHGPARDPAGRQADPDGLEAGCRAQAQSLRARRSLPGHDPVQAPGRQGAARPAVDGARGRRPSTTRRSRRGSSGTCGRPPVAPTSGWPPRPCSRPRAATSPPSMPCSTPTPVPTSRDC